MISLRRFLQADSKDEQTLLRIVQLLLQGIGLHAVEGEPTEYRRFRDAMQAICESFEDSGSTDDMLSKVGSALRALEAYNRSTSDYLREQNTELQAMVKMLTATIGDLSAASDQNVSRLRDIEAKVASASQVEDVREVKVRLFECLAQIRSESERQRIATNRVVQRLSVDLEKSEKRAASLDSQADLATGLLSRSAAEASLADACHTALPAYAAVMVLDRLAAYNLRFGRAIGDQVLRTFADFLARRADPEDRLFRWSGPTLVGLIVRPGGIDKVRADVHGMLRERLEQKVHTEIRSFVLPITARWAVFPMMASPRLLIRKIDSFASFVAERD